MHSNPPRPPSSHNYLPRVGESPRKRLVVGVADMVATNDVTAEIVTYSLGSCVAVTMYDPIKKVGGMLHAMLPCAADLLQPTRQSPYIFMDVGLPALIRTVRGFGARLQQLEIKAAGGAHIMNDDSVFSIGARNCEALKKALEKEGLRLTAERLGGRISRSMRLDIAEGKVSILTPGCPTEVL
ncbi:MAG: chemotaxis protein CheD [Candidatus Methylacidiphilales bacterium]|nr:chemotaxis protein CheD [Candidatus Methylacidiphilales bacterium]